MHNSGKHTRLKITFPETNRKKTFRVSTLRTPRNQKNNKQKFPTLSICLRRKNNSSISTTSPLLFFITFSNGRCPLLDFPKFLILLFSLFSHFFFNQLIDQNCSPSIRIKFIFYFKWEINLFAWMTSHWNSIILRWKNQECKILNWNMMNKKATASNPMFASDAHFPPAVHF